MLGDTPRFQVSDGKGWLLIDGFRYATRGYLLRLVDWVIDECFPEQKPATVRVVETKETAMGEIEIRFVYEMPPFVPASIQGL